MVISLKRVKKKLKKCYQIIGGYIAGIITFWSFSIALSGTVPSINLESVVISRDKTSAVISNNNPSSLESFHAEFYVYLDNEIIHIPRKEIGALVGSGGRRVFDLPYHKEKPQKIVACISYPGAYFTDTVWQKVELYSPYTDPLSAMHGIFTFNGETTRVGHNYLFGADCDMES